MNIRYMSIVAFCLVACGGAEPKHPSSSASMSNDTTGRVSDSMVRSEATPAPQPMTTTPTTAVTPMTTDATPATPATSPVAAAPEPPPLNDGQIINVLQTANDGEIEQAKLAQKNAKNARVKQFASMMLKAHESANAKAKDVAKKGNLVPSSSDESAKLAAAAQQHTSTLTASKGRDFDKAYIEAQIAEHQAVIELINGKLMNHAQNPETKKLLEKLRPEIEAHLKHAQEVQKALAK